MKKITTLIFLAVLLFAGEGWGADFAVYIDSAWGGAKNGTIAEPYDGLNDVTAGNWTSLANSATAGDDARIYLKKGSAFTTTLTVGGSGISGNPIIITSYDAGADPTITGGAYSITDTGYDYITIDGIDFVNSTTDDINLVGATDYITVQNCNFSGLADTRKHFAIAGGTGSIITNNTFAQAATTGYVLITTGAVTNLTFSDNTITGNAAGTPDYCIYFYTNTGLTFSGNTITDWQLSAADKKLVYFRDNPSVTALNNTIGQTGHTNDGYGYYVSSTNAAHTFSATSDIITGQNYDGVYLTSITATLTDCQSNSNTGAAGRGFNVTTGATVTASGCSATGNNSYNWVVQQTGALTATSCIGSSSVVSNGFFQLNGATLTATSCTANSNYEDGFSSNNTGTVTCINCTANNNGNVASASSGDGFTAHDTSTVNLVLCKGSGNFKSGFAAAGGSGTVYQCTFYNNYEATNGNGYGDSNGMGMGFGGGVGPWNVRNNICAYNGDEIAVSAAAVAGGIVFTNLDYDCHDNSREAGGFFWNGASFTSLADFIADAATDGYAVEAHGKDADPKFVSTTDFHLLAGSPCIWAGTDLNIATDADGIAFHATTPSMGCYEFHGHGADGGGSGGGSGAP